MWGRRMVERSRSASDVVSREEREGTPCRLCVYNHITNMHDSRHTGKYHAYHDNTRIPTSCTSSRTHHVMSTPLLTAANFSCLSFCCSSLCRVRISTTSGCCMTSTDTMIYPRDVCMHVDSMWIGEPDVCDEVGESHT